ncbi:MAG TPA: hypothetical protein VFT42_04720 [Solirubrobacteraceae bacterium]|nr:hypothetical protein [Solirubrobacteraceae bacterium]
MSDSHHFRKQVAGLCMLFAPALVLVSAIVSPKLSSNGGTQLRYASAHLDRWYLAQVLALAALVLLVPAILGLMHMLRERQVAMGHVGGALALIGVMAATALTGAALLIWQMAEPARNIAQMALVAHDFGRTAGVVVALMIPTIGFALGFIALAYGLFRARAVHWMSALLMAAGAVALDLGFGPVASNALAIAGCAALTIGLGSIGWAVLTETDDAWAHTPEFHGFGGASAA